VPKKWDGRVVGYVVTVLCWSAPYRLLPSPAVMHAEGRQTSPLSVSDTCA